MSSLKETCINVKKASLKKLGYVDLQDWLKNKNHLYCGRDMTIYVAGAIGSKWKNPFSVKKYGLQKCLELYEKHLHDSNLIQDISELKGKTLGCSLEKNLSLIYFFRWQALILCCNIKLSGWCVEFGKYQTEKNKIVCHTQILLKLLHQSNKKKKISILNDSDFPPLS